MSAVLASSNSTNFTSVDNTTGINITKPTGLAVGDLMVAFIAVVQSSAGANDTSLKSGWTNISNDVNGFSTVAWRSMYKVAEQADVDATTFNFKHGIAGSRYLGGGMSRITGAIANFTVKSNQDINGTSFTTADLTPANANSLLLFFSLKWNGATGVSSQACATSNPTWAEAYDFGSTSPNPDVAIALAYANRPETTSTGDFSISPSSRYVGHFIALSPVVSTNYPITASQGAFTLTGQSTLLKIGRKILASVGSFVLTGQSILLKLAWKMLSSFGSFVLSGQNALLKIGKGMVAGGS